MKGPLPHIISLLFIASISLSAASVPLFSSEIFRSKESVELKPSKKCRISADIPFGNIFIKKSKNKKLTVSLEKSIESSNKPKSLKILEKINLSCSESRKNIKITVKKNRYLKKIKSLDLYIFIPTKHDLELFTGEGSIRMDDYRGSAAVKTAGGSIIAGSISDGSLEASTSGGNIITGNINDGSLKAETKGGNINCGDIKNKADLKTHGGNISAGSTGDNLTAETAGGNITAEGCMKNAELISKSGSIRGGIFKGRLKAETKGGNIEIEECTENTVLLSYGGDISVTKLLGNLKAETYGGEITASVGRRCSDRSDIELYSKGGDISIKVPEKLSFKLDAEVKISKKNKRELRIKSDFTDNRISNNSGKTKKISSGGVFYGGSSKIKLSANNSSIYIYKY